MPDLLAIEWDPQCLRGVDVQATGNSILVRHLFELPQASGRSQSELKEWFGQYLAEKRISTKQVVVTLPRESVVVRRLEMPDVGDDELPVMVRFQAAAKSSLTLDELSLDFIPLPKRDGIVTRDVLLAMVPQAMIAAIRDLVESAQKELVAIRLSPVGAAELATRIEDKPNDSKSASLIVARHGERVEISVTWMHQLIFSHAARLADDHPEQQTAVILTEISRGLMSFQNLNLGVKLTEGYLLGSEADFPGLAAALQKRLQIAVRAINPFSLVRVAENMSEVAQPSAFAGVLGSIWTQTQATVQSFDFLAPRKPPVKADTSRERKRQLAIGGVGLAAVIAVGYWTGLSNLDASIDSRTEQISQIDGELKKGKPTQDAAKSLEVWAKEDFNLLDELKRFQELVPSTKQMYLTKLIIKTPVSQQQQSGEVQGQIRAEGHVREIQDLRKFREKLKAPETGYELSENPEVRESKEFYPIKLDEQIKVKKRPAAKPEAAQ